MLKIKIVSVGKTKEKWLEEAIGEYLKRLSKIVQFDFFWAKNDLQLLELARREKYLICLDPAGKLFSSEEFSHFITQQWQSQGSRLTLIIGGAEGLPQELRKDRVLISLSPLTFTHQMTRLILIEQIYRAIEIQKNSDYHKS